MSWKTILYIMLRLAVIIVIALVYGSIRWRSATKEMHAKLEEARLSIKTTRYDSKELNGLPAPVQRYFRAVLRVRK